MPATPARKAGRLAPQPANLSPPILAPSLLSADFANLAASLRATWRAGARWLHLDIMDRQFVPNLTFGAPVIRAIRPVKPAMVFDAHLMVENPGDHIADLAAAGCQYVTIHTESPKGDTAAIIRDIRQQGMKPGLAIKPATPLEALEPFLTQIDLALVMTVEPGFGGQALIPQCLNKVRDLARARNARDDWNFLIQVDGGINASTIALAASAGAEVLVAGNAVFNSEPPETTIPRLVSLMNTEKP